MADVALWTVQEYYDEFRAAVRDEDHDRWDATTIFRRLNQALIEVVRFTHILFDEDIFTTVPTQRVYTRDEIWPNNLNLLCIDGKFIYRGSTYRTPIEEKMRSEFNAQGISSGSPRMYLPTVTGIILYPTPAVAESIKVPGRAYPTKMENTVAGLALNTEIPAEFQQVVPQLAAYICKLYDDEPNAGNLAQVAGSFLREMLGDVNAEQHGNDEMLVEDLFTD